MLRKGALLSNPIVPKEKYNGFLEVYWKLKKKLRETGNNEQTDYFQNTAGVKHFCQCSLASLPSLEENTLSSVSLSFVLVIKSFFCHVVLRLKDLYRRKWKHDAGFSTFSASTYVSSKVSYGHNILCFHGYVKAVLHENLLSRKVYLVCIICTKNIRQAL